MDRAAEARQLKDSTLWRAILNGWRSEVIDDMLDESDPRRRESLWAEQHYLSNLSERIDVELDSIIGGRESEHAGREPES